MGSNKEWRHTICTIRRCHNDPIELIKMLKNFISLASLIFGFGNSDEWNFNYSRTASFQ